MDGFVSIFSAYWWLLFPLGFFIVAGWRNYLHFKSTQTKLELLKTYAASGKEPPAALLADIESEPASLERSAARGTGATAFLVTLFSGLALVFGGLGYTGLLGDYGVEFYIAAAILGVLALAFLVSGVATGGRQSQS